MRETGFVEVLVRPQAEAAGNDFFLDLGGAAEDRLDGQVLEMAGLWDLPRQPNDDLVGGMSGGRSLGLEGGCDVALPDSIGGLG